MSTLAARTLALAPAARKAPPAAPLSELSPSAKIFAFATMCVGFFIALLDIQIVSASLRDIGGGLSAGADETAWVQTSYLIAEIIVIPLSGWLSRVLSTRWQHQSVGRPPASDRIESTQEPGRAASGVPQHASSPAKGRGS